jgi:hypothetical protein
VKVLFDHNVPHKLRHSFDGHLVSTADEMGWAELENGQLLRAAEESGFEVMITGTRTLAISRTCSEEKLPWLSSAQIIGTS